MRSNSGNIRTEEYLDAASEPGVVGSGCGWLHRAGSLLSSMFVLIMFVAPARSRLWHTFFSINFICHSFTKQCSAGQNDVKVALNATWLFRLRSHSKKSDTYPIQYHI